MELFLKVFSALWNHFFSVFCFTQLVFLFRLLIEMLLGSTQDKDWENNNSTGLFLTASTGRKAVKIPKCLKSSTYPFQMVVHSDLIHQSFNQAGILIITWIFNFLRIFLPIFKDNFAALNSISTNLIGAVIEMNFDCGWNCVRGVNTCCLINAMT